MRLRAALLLSVLLPLPLLAQDPPPPAGGFAVGVRDHRAGNPNGPVTLVDGVRTELTVYYPLAAPPATGWPVVLLVHGGSGSRNIPPLRTRGRYLARAGYVCLAYDVRGAASTLVLNPVGFDASEPARLRDVAELLTRANDFLPAGAAADPTRLAVTGESMGGRHCYRAAAWSGLALPGPIAPYTHMPVISAIAPRLAPLDPVGDCLHRGILFSAEVATQIYLAPATHPDRIDLLAENYAAIAARRAADPLLQYLPGVAASNVPILITNLWEDAKHQLAPTVDALPTLPATLPVRTWWTTNGHGSTENDQEELANNEAIRRWFDYFLKGLANGVTTEPGNECGYAPPVAGLHLDPSSHWQHAMFGQWPPSGISTRTVYLRTTGGQQLLSNVAPVAVEPGAVVTNALLDPLYDIERFCQDDRRPSQVLAAMALDDEVFTGPPLPGDLEIIGRSRFRAIVDCDAADFYLTAALYAVAPNGTEKLITAGTHGVRGGAPGATALDVELDDTAFVVPGGFRLLLRLRNLSLMEFPANRFIRWVPCFAASNTTVRIDPATPARLELPARPRPHAFVTPRMSSAIAAAGVLARFEVNGGTARGGQFYLLLLGASGYSPGALFAPELLPINLDFWTFAVAATPTGPFFPGFSGLLDASGRAPAALDLRAIAIPPVLLGVRWTLAVLGQDAGGYWGGGPAEFEIWP